ncbi:hypothetical protein [Natronococcus sp.]|uniref:hypothetical protein n=1 Tax=Natronococcus sp. TaxID=35747 RepID=UPI0025D5DC1D|nr:hypothetical protein [Natronococcus sp.]
MDRRTLLGLTTGVGTTALAGCLGTLSEVTGPETEHVTIGNGNETNGTDVVVRNAGSEERTVAIELGRDGETVLERTETLPAEDALEIALLETGTYTLVVETDTGRSETSVTRSTDCADARTEVVVSEHGLGTTTASSC